MEDIEPEALAAAVVKCAGADLTTNTYVRVPVTRETTVVSLSVDIQSRLFELCGKEVIVTSLKDENEVFMSSKDRVAQLFSERTIRLLATCELQDWRRPYIQMSTEPVQKSRQHAARKDACSQTEASMFHGIGAYESMGSECAKESHDEQYNALSALKRKLCKVSALVSPAVKRWCPGFVRGVYRSTGIQVEGVGSLDDRVLEEVLSRLGTRYLPAAAPVCRRWHHIVSTSPRVWRHLNWGCLGRDPRYRMQRAVAMAGGCVASVTLDGAHAYAEDLVPLEAADASLAALSIRAMHTIDDAAVYLVRRLTALETLTLCDVAVVHPDSYRHLARLTRLSRLELGDFNCHVPQPVTQDCFGDPLTADVIEYLTARLPALTALHLSGLACDAGDFVAAAARATQLEELTIAVHVPPSHLAESMTPFNPQPNLAQVSKLTCLRALQLTGLDSTTSLHPLASARCLRQLHLKDVALSPSLSSLTRALPMLTDVDLSLDDSGDASLLGDVLMPLSRSLRRLGLATIASESWTGRAADHQPLPELPTLTHLHLDIGTLSTDVCLHGLSAWLATCSSLRYLSMVFSEQGPASVSALVDLSMLERLELELRISCPGPMLVDMYGLIVGLYPQTVVTAQLPGYGFIDINFRCQSSLC